MMLEHEVITTALETGGAHDRTQVKDGADRATTLFGERAQNAMQNEEESKEDQATSNSEQEDIFNDSEQEDLFGEEEDDTSVETAIHGGDRNIERVVINGDGMAWINIPTRVA